MSTTVEPTQATPTSEQAPVAALAPAPAGGRLYRLSVEQYHKIAEAGILGPPDQVEMIEGLLVKKMTRNERHLTTTWLIQQELWRVLPPGYIIGKEDPIVLARSEPEPDISILKGVVRDYFGRKPSAQDALLVIEVADSSYSDDLLKLSIYAEARIPSCWIVNLVARRIEVYSDPTGPDERPMYRNRRDYGQEDLLPVVIEGRELARFPIAELLPPAVA